MGSIETLQDYVAAGDIQVVNCVAVTRSRSTAFGRALGQSGPDDPRMFVNEPFSARTGECEVGADLLLHAVEPVLEESKNGLTVVTKNMAAYMSPEVFGFMSSLAIGNVWNVREPHIQIGSLLERGINDTLVGFGADEITQELVPDFWDKLSEVYKSGQAFRTGWPSILEHYQDRGDKPSVVVDSEVLVRNPKRVLEDVCEKLGLTYHPRMENNWQQSYINIGGANYSSPEQTMTNAWIAHATQSHGIDGRNVREPIDLNGAPPELRHFITWVAMPTYRKITETDIETRQPLVLDGLPEPMSEIYEPQTDAIVREYNTEQGLHVFQIEMSPIDDRPHGLLLIGVPEYSHEMGEQNEQVSDLVIQWLLVQGDRAKTLMEGREHREVRAQKLDLPESVTRFGETGLVAFYGMKYEVPTQTTRLPWGGLKIMQEFAGHHPELELTEQDILTFLALRTIRQWSDRIQQEASDGQMSLAPSLKEHMLHNLLLQTEENNVPGPQIPSYDDIITTAKAMLAPYGGERFFGEDETGVQTFVTGEPGSEQFRAFKDFFTRHTTTRELPDENERSALQLLAEVCHDETQKWSIKRLGHLLCQSVNPVFVTHQMNISEIVDELRKFASDPHGLDQYRKEVVEMREDRIRFLTGKGMSAMDAILLVDFDTEG